MKLLEMLGVIVFFAIAGLSLLAAADVIFSRYEGEGTVKTAPSKRLAMRLRNGLEGWRERAVDRLGKLSWEPRRIIRVSKINIKETAMARCRREFVRIVRRESGRRR
jgi:hypothetical protein